MTCRKCGEEKYGSEFYERKTLCKTCYKQRSKEWRLRHQRKPRDKTESQVQLFQKIPPPEVFAQNGAFVHRRCRQVLQPLRKLGYGILIGYCYSCIEQVAFNKEVATRCRRIA